MTTELRKLTTYLPATACTISAGLLLADDNEQSEPEMMTAVKKELSTPSSTTIWRLCHSAREGFRFIYCRMEGSRKTGRLQIEFCGCFTEPKLN